MKTYCILVIVSSAFLTEVAISEESEVERARRIIAEEPLTPKSQRETAAHYRKQVAYYNERLARETSPEEIAELRKDLAKNEVLLQMWEAAKPPQKRPRPRNPIWPVPDKADAYLRRDELVFRRKTAAAKMIQSVRDFVKGQAEGAIVETILDNTVGVVISVLTDVKKTANVEADSPIIKWKSRCDNFLARDAGRRDLLRNKQQEYDRLLKTPAPRGLRELGDEVESLSDQIDAEEPARTWCRDFAGDLKIVLRPSKGTKYNVVP